MRLWSLHPQYLDAKGLVALWREGLLAKAVLDGQTKGYRNHPQLVRFKAHANPTAAINTYLWHVHEEAKRRSYHFDVNKLGEKRAYEMLPVTEGQLKYEWEHLQDKLKTREEQQFEKNLSVTDIHPHPLMEIIPGGIEAWERIPAK